MLSCPIVTSNWCQSLNPQQKVLHKDRFFRVPRYEYRAYAMSHFGRKLPQAIAATGAESGT